MRFAGFTPVLLSVFVRDFSIDDLIASAVDTRHRLAKAGETETPLTGHRSATKIDVTTYRDERPIETHSLRLIVLNIEPYINELYP